MGYYKAYDDKDNGVRFKGFSKGKSADKLNFQLDELFKNLSGDDLLVGVAESLIKEFLRCSKDDIIREYKNMSDEDRREIETEMKKIYYDTSNDEGKAIVEYFYKGILSEPDVPWKLNKSADNVPKIFHGNEKEFANVGIGKTFYNNFGTYIKTTNITTDRGNIINAIRIKGVGTYENRCGLPLFFKPTAKVMEINE